MTFVDQTQTAGWFTNGDLWVTPYRNRSGEHLVVEWLDDAWLAAYHVDTSGAAPAIREVWVVPRDDRGSIAADVVLRFKAHVSPRSDNHIPLNSRTVQGMHPRRVIGHFQKVGRVLGEAWLAEIGVSRDSLEATPDTRRKDRRARDRWLAVIANVYVSVCDQGSRTPVQDARAVVNATRNDAPPLSVLAVRDLLKEARQNDLLTRPADGRRQGGRLTAKALKLLSEMP